MSRRCPTPEARAKAGEEFRRRSSSSVTTSTPSDEVAQRTCTWTCEPNPDIEMWETDCGNAFQFEAGGPTENKMKFCCYCGKRLAGRDAEGREEGEGDG